MSLINITNLTFAYEGSYDNIFDHVSFQIDTDWKLGFTGRNGRGKTTFLNLLLGRYNYRGNISAKVNFDYFPFEVPDKSQDTIEVINCICTDCLDWELKRELSLLKVSEDVLYRPFNTLSKGEQGKILLATLFLKDNNFLLIDEPTNHLDLEARAIVSHYLKSKKGFILVSHDRSFLDGCIDHILSINKTNIDIQQGDFSSWLLNKNRQDRFELAENSKLKQEIKRLEKTAKEKVTWSNTAEKRKIGFDPIKTEKSTGRRAFEGAKSKKLMKNAKTMEKRQERAFKEKSKLLKNLESSEPLKITQLPFHSNPLVSLHDISIFYNSKIACQNISFSIEQGDRIALCGKNGSGKSSVLKLICGEEMTYTGRFQKSSRLIISYVSQDTSFLSGNLTDYALQNNIDESLFKAILRKLDFSRVQFEKNMADFSGGQKKKVLIAKSLCEKAHLHLWDEPLNFIDVISRIQIENLILRFKPTLLFVEHDHSFLNNVSTKQIMMEK
ncbi:MAG: ribosomal protection-like ABC-F family protein [Eubacteriaceae bacterium]